MFRVIFLCVISTILASCTRQLTLSQTNAQQYYLNNQSPSDNTIQGMLRPYRDSLEVKVNRVLATSEADLLARSSAQLSSRQTALGNFVVDACLAVAKQKAKTLGKPEPDISIITWGSIRGSIPKGNVTLLDIYQLMPFENEMVVLTLNASQVRVLFNKLALGNNPVSGAIVKKGATTQILINEKPLDETQLYYVLTSDYLAFGGDNMDILKDVSDRYFCESKVRDALILYLENLKANGQNLVPDYEQRITN